MRVLVDSFITEEFAVPLFISRKVRGGWRRESSCGSPVKRRQKYAGRLVHLRERDAGINS